MESLVLFDIDCTLIDGHGAGKRAVLRALREVYGAEGDLGDYSFHGRTDPGIVRDLAALWTTTEHRDGDGDAIEERLEACLARYVELLREELAEGAVEVLPGVRQLVTALAADRRAATPSAAAELVSPSGEHLRHRVLALAQRLGGAQGRRLVGIGQRLGAVSRHLRLLHPAAALQRRGQILDDLERRLLVAAAARVDRARQRLAPAAARLAANSPGRGLPGLRLLVRALGRRMTLAAARVAEVRRERLTLAVQGLQARSPLATLARGYAIVTRLPDGLILRDAAQAPAGTQVRARVADGELICRVEEDRRIGDPRAES